MSVVQGVGDVWLDDSGAADSTFSPLKVGRSLVWRSTCGRGVRFQLARKSPVDLPRERLPESGPGGRGVARIAAGTEGEDGACRQDHRAGFDRWQERQNELLSDGRRLAVSRFDDPGGQGTADRLAHSGFWSAR